MPYAAGIFLGVLPTYPQAENRLIPSLLAVLGAAQNMSSFACIFITLSALFSNKSRI
jgi:hypothetical protein